MRCGSSAVGGVSRSRSSNGGPPWNPDFGSEWSSVKVAQLRYEEAAGAWTLYCSDSNGRWHRFDQAAPTKTVEPLLGMIEADPTGILWG